MAQQNYNCPDCGNRLSESKWNGMPDYTGPDRWHCQDKSCPSYKAHKYWYLNEIQGKSEMKKCIYKYTHNKSIVELKFQTTSRKGAWKENIQPLINSLKAGIPSSNRSYDPSTFKWEIAIEYWEPYKNLIVIFGATFQEEQEVKSAEIPNIHVPEDYAANFFHEQAPLQEVETKESLAAKLSQYLGVTIAAQELSELKTLYRQKARQLHPDLGGDATKMSELNRLWTLYTAQDRMVN